MSIDAFIAKDDSGTVRAALRSDMYDEPDRLSAAVDAMAVTAVASLERMKIAGSIVVESVQLPFDTWEEAVEHAFGKPWPLADTTPGHVAGNVALKASTPAVQNTAPAVHGPRMSTN